MGNSMSFFSSKKIFESKSMETFPVNGGLLLEKLNGLCDGRSNPIRMFSVEELNLATNNFDERVCSRCFCDLYKGVHQGRPIIVKEYGQARDNMQMAINDIVYASGMSVHRNVLKCLGCCLEADRAFLVFETAQNKTLADVIYDDSYYAQFQPMPWKTRLKIAVDIAHAVVYLHTAFQRPVVHRGITPSNVLLDEHDKAKLYDFSSCVSIPEGESDVEAVLVGTFDFIAPESMGTGLFSEKTDVYGFGVFLLVLLTGQRPYTFCLSENGHVHLVPYVKSQIENNRFEEIVAPCIVAEGMWLGKEQQLKAVICLAILCINDSGEERPTMIEVAKELRNIYRTANGPC